MFMAGQQEGIQPVKDCSSSLTSFFRGLLEIPTYFQWSVKNLGFDVGLALKQASLD